VAPSRGDHSHIRPIGASFPGTWQSSVPFFRTDLGEWYYYDGTRWLSAVEYPLTYATYCFAASYANNAVPWGAVIPNPGGSLYFTRAECLYQLGATNNGSNYWSLNMHIRDSAYGTNTTIASPNTSAATGGTQYRASATINTAYAPSTFLEMYMMMNSTGSPTVPGNMIPAIFYRKIAT
jgi:hypothetical protein